MNSCPLKEFFILQLKFFTLQLERIEHGLRYHGVLGKNQLKSIAEKRCASRKDNNDNLTNRFGYYGEQHRKPDLAAVFAVT